MGSARGEIEAVGVRKWSGPFRLGSRRNGGDGGSHPCSLTLGPVFPKIVEVDLVCWCGGTSGIGRFGKPNAFRSFFTLNT